MNIVKLQKSIDIFAKYFSKEELIFSCVTDKFSGPNKRKFKISEEDSNSLKNMGWFYSRENDCWQIYC